MNEIAQVTCTDKSGTHEYSVRLLKEFGNNFSLTPQKVAELWAQVKKHDVLFSDHTQGQAEPFLAILFNPASVWLEVVRESDQELVGSIYIDSVIVNFDAKGHFTVWDGIAKGREKIFHETMRWMFGRYNLRRISAEAPPYQGGVLRFVEKRLGMKKEGEKREAVLYKTRWWPLIQFGITRDELAEILVSYEDVQSLNNSLEVQHG